MDWTGVSNNALKQPETIISKYSTSISAAKRSSVTMFALLKVTMRTYLEENHDEVLFFF